MERSIYAYIRRHSWRQQLTILGLTLLSFPPLYYSLELPKTIINHALGEADGPFSLLGYPLDRVSFLFALCGIFLALVLIGGILKYVMNVYAGTVAERMLRRLRYQLYDHVLRFPLPHFRRVSQGELVQMINAETEALGGYVGDAVAVPAFQGGTLLTILIFMFMQDPVLGLAAISLYPVQMYLIPKLQAQVNALGKQRVRQVRRNAERISETVVGVRDIRANDATQFERARFSEQLGTVYWIRFAIYKKKFLIKFINNFIAQLGPFFFFSIGGYLVIKGQISLGALVAVVGAHKDLASPWKELLTYYQTMFDVKIKYEQTVAQFVPPGLVPERQQMAEGVAPPPLRGRLEIRGLTVVDDGETLLDSIEARLDLPARVALLGPAGSGKEELTLALAGLIAPQSGRICIDDVDLTGLPEAALGSKIAYIGSPGYVFGGSLADNLLYGLKHRPLAEPKVEGEEENRRARERTEARQSGNSPHDPFADWVDYAAAGIARPEQRLPAIVDALRIATFDQDVYLLGLRGSVQERHGDLVDRLLEARRAVQERLAGDERVARLVEPFDPDLYNSNATMAENLLFGVPVDDRIDLDRLAADPHVLRTLDSVGLTEELREVGLELARTMVELFADLPPDHEYFRQFSFIAPEDLGDYRALVARADPRQLDRLGSADRERLLALPFKVIPARHRLGALTEAHQQRLVEARHWFRDHLPRELEGAIAFFEPDHYSRPLSIQDNIIFGKIAYGQAQAQARVGALITDVLDGLGLRDRVCDVGLDFECGVGGGRLSAAQRQKVVIARAVLKQPEMVILYDATSALDAQDQVTVRDRLLEAMDQRTVVWSLPVADWASLFDQVLTLDGGRIADGPQPARGRGSDAAAREAVEAS